MNSKEHKSLNRIGTYRKPEGHKLKMTYIVGANCTDGVVLVGDRKLSVGDTEEACEDKLFQLEIGEVVVGASGSKGLFDKFLELISIKVKQALDFKSKEYLILDAINDCEDIAKELTERYFNRIRETIDVLIAFRGDNGIPVLYTVSGLYGFSETVNKYKAIGHGEPYGSIFLKTMWHTDMTMSEFSKIAYFVIRCIEEMKLDSSVGYDPQTWFIPRIIPEEGKTIGELKEKYPIRQATDKESEEMFNHSDTLICEMERFLREFKKSKDQDLKVGE